MQQKPVQNQPRKLNFIAYAHLQSDRKKSLGRLGVARNYNIAISRFSSFLATLGRKDIPFSKMTMLLLSDFEEWLHRQGCCRNTSATYLRSMRSIWGRAVKEGLAVGNPFEGTFRGVTKTRKRAVSPNDIRRLFDLDIESALLQTVRRQVPANASDIRVTSTGCNRLVIFSFSAFVPVASPLSPWPI